MIIEMAACKGDTAGEKSGFPTLSKRIVSPAQKQVEKGRLDDEPSLAVSAALEEDIDVDLREVYFLIMHFLSSGPCNRASGQLWNELLQHKLLPRRYHAWHSRTGVPSGDEDDDGSSFPLSYIQVVERHPNIEKNHLVNLLRQQLIASRRAAAALEHPSSRIPTAADVPTLLGLGSFSLLDSEFTRGKEKVSQLLSQLRWPHWQSNQVHGLTLREFGGGFARHHRSPSLRAASYAIVKPSILVDRIQIIKKFRGHRNAVYCAIFDRSGRYIITGSDDRLVKIWSTETGFCLRSCRGHEGDITELAVSSGNALVASASNDCTIRVWHLPDGVPVSVLRGHSGAVTAIAFSPRQSCEHHLLSSSDDGTCRIWDARDSSVKSRVYMPKPEASSTTAKSNVPAQPVSQSAIQISCCAFNADGSIFVTGSSDRFARVWDARKWHDEITGKPNHELDVLRGHENAVNYVQFSGCAGPVKSIAAESGKEERTAKFKNSWSVHDSIVTCSRDGSAIIWIHKSRRKDARSGRWAKAYHLRVPPPPMPPQPPRGGGPRQRLLPTPRGVNMIVWSLDNRFVLAAIMDCRICVWNAVDGSLVHSLTGHTKSTYVVDVHPFNPKIAMSAGYDGRVIIWDIYEGRPVRTYETGDFEIVDGCFSPDGTSIVVSDDVGQIYLLSTGQGESQKDAKYDQFFLGDFRPLVRDIQGNVLDQETQLPPHQRNIQDLLCDANMIPYQEPYQSMYQQRRLGALGIDWQPPPTNFAVGSVDDFNYIGFGENPLGLHQVIQGSPIETGADGAMRWVEQPTDADEAMDWEQDLTRFSEDSESDYSVSEESLSLPDDEGTASSTEGIGHSDEDEGDSKEASIQETQLRRSNRNKQKTEGMVSSSVTRRVRRKLADSQETDEVSADAVDRRSTRQRQAKDSHAHSSALRPELLQPARPKRVAAKNALQFFSHISTNEDEDQDELSSSQHDTSSYSTEKEPESDGPPLSPSLSSGQKDVCENKNNTKKGMEELTTSENKIEASESNDREANFEIDEKEEIYIKDEREELNQKEEYSETDIKDENMKEDVNAEFYNKDEGDQNSGKDDEQICEKDMKEDFSERDTSSKVEVSERGEFSRRPRSQRRLVLKLRKGAAKLIESNCLGHPEDQPSAEDPFVSNTGESQRDGNQRRLTRLVFKPPQPAAVLHENSGSLSDTGDNDYNGVAHDGPMTSLLDGVGFSEAYRRMLSNGKRKSQSTMLRVSKKSKNGFGGDSSEPGDRSPFPLDCSSDRSASNSEAFKDESGKALKSDFFDVDLKSTSYDTEAHSGGIKNLSRVETLMPLPEHLHTAAGETLHSEKGIIENTVQRSTMLYSAPRLRSLNSKNLNGSLEEPERKSQNDRRITRSGANTRQKQMESSRGVSQFKVSGVWMGQTQGMVRMVDEARHRQGDVQKIIPAQGHGFKGRNRPRGIGNYSNHIIQAGRKASAPNVMEKIDDHDDLHLSPLYDAGEEIHHVLENSPRKITVRTRGALKKNDEIEGFERNDRRVKMEYSNGITQALQKERDHIRQFSSEGNSEHDFLHGNESWSESQSEEERQYDDEGNLRHKRRTLGELDSTNNLIQISNEDFMGKRRVRHMRSVMSEGGKEMRMKGSRERRVPLNKGKEPLERSGRRHTWAESMSWHGKQQQGRHAYDTEENLSESPDMMQMAEFNGLPGIDLQRSEEDGTSMPNERKGIRVSRRARREVTRRDISGDRYQGRLCEVTAGTRDKGIRTRKSSSWLLQSEAEEGTRYIPQFDDEVVYLRQGHQEFLESCKLDEPGPWTIFKNSIRAVEICRVIQIDYSILANSGDTCCKLTLEFTDCTTHLQGKTFRLSLPELTDFPDFLVEKSRYDAAIERNWTHRDRCKVWWRSADGQGGEWWEGRVIAVKPKSSDFPDSPWDRFLVQYKTDTSKPLNHSPWELFDPNNGMWEVPHTDEEQRAHSLAILESATNRPDDAYGLHKLKQLASRSDFINRVPLPLTLDIIKQRLENDYYRCAQAFYFDVRLLISNAESHYGSNSILGERMQRFSQYISEEFSSCDFTA